jgi:hypothetical protein
VALHALVFGLWGALDPRGLDELPPIEPYVSLELTPVPLTSIATEPPGGGGSPPPAEETPPDQVPATPTLVPERPDPAMETQPVVPLVPALQPPPLTTVHPATPLPGRPAAPGTRPGTGTGGTGTGDGAGDGPGAGRGDGAGAGDGDGDGRGAPIVRDPDRAPFQVGQVLPVWPEEAERADYRARVRVEVVVSAEVDGSTRLARVVEVVRVVERMRLGRGEREEPVASLPFGMEEEALRAARLARFRPARQDGQAVPSYGTVTVLFGVR